MGKLTIIQTAGYCVMRGLVVLAGLHGSLAVDTVMDISDLQQVPYFEKLPEADREFIKAYIKFIKATAPVYFYPVIIVLIVVGVIGNTCFVLFFANHESRSYRTKDALFFRRMSLIDFLICVVVMPYAMVYESRIITDNKLCRGLEFCRHVLIYASHLLLTFYSLELTSRDNYSTTKKRFNRTTVFVVIFSVVLAAPALIIFEAGNPHTLHDIYEENASLVEPIIMFPIPANDGDMHILPSGLQPADRMTYFNPNFCHLSRNMDTYDPNFDLVRILKVWYMMMNGFVFFVSAFTLVAQIINLMESNPFLGRNSMFVQVIEINYPELTRKLHNIEVNNQERRQQRRSMRASMRASRRTFNGPREDASEDKHSAISSVNSHKHGHGNRKSQRFDGGSEVDAPQKTQHVTIAPGHPGSLHPHVQAPVSTEDVGSLSAAGTHSTKAATKRVNWGTDEAGVYEGVSLCQYICSCQVCRSRRKRVRLLGSAEHRVHSFKYSIICLMTIDLLVFCVATVGYIITDQMSFILNVVHFKSVFSFFILSLINEDLNYVTWDRSSSHDKHGPSNEDVTSGIFK